MKTVTEFFAIHLTNAAKVLQEQVTAGKTPEELPAALVEALKPVMKIADDKIPLLMHALEVVEGKAKDLKRVVVYTGPETEKAPAGTVKKGEHHFLVEHFTTQRQAAPDTQEQGRGGPGGRDKKGGKRGGPGGGGRDAGRGGPGGGGRGGERGPGGSPRPAGGGAPIANSGAPGAPRELGAGGDQQRPRGPREARPPRGGAGGPRPQEGSKPSITASGGLPKPLPKPLMSKTAVVATAVAVTAVAAAAVVAAVSAHHDKPADAAPEADKGTPAS